MFENIIVFCCQLFQFVGFSVVGFLFVGCMLSGGGSGSLFFFFGFGFGVGKFIVIDFLFLSWLFMEEVVVLVMCVLFDGYKKINEVGIIEVFFFYNEYFKQFMLQVCGGQFIGVVYVDVVWFVLLVVFGKLEDVLVFMKGCGYIVLSFEVIQFDGKQYVFLWIIGVIGLIMNFEFLNKVGIFMFFIIVDDFEVVLKKFKGFGGGLIFYVVLIKVVQFKDVLIWMQMFGSDFVKDGKVMIGDDVSIEVVIWYKLLYDQGFIVVDVDCFDVWFFFVQG